MIDAIVSIIKDHPKIKGEFEAFDCNKKLIGRITEIKKGDKQLGYEKYRIVWIGSDVDGKISYAIGWPDLNDKVSYIAKTCFNKPTILKINKLVNRYY